MTNSENNYQLPLVNKRKREYEGDSQERSQKHQKAERSGKMDNSAALRIDNKHIPELYVDMDMHTTASNTTTEKKSIEVDLSRSGSLPEPVVDLKSSSTSSTGISSTTKERIQKRKYPVDLEEDETVSSSPSPSRDVKKLKSNTEEAKVSVPVLPEFNVSATSKNSDNEQEQLVYKRLLKSFYYMDCLHANSPFTEAIEGWRSLFPYVKTIMKQMQEKNEHILYGLCCSLMSLIHFYLFRRLEKTTKPDLAAYFNNEDSITGAKELIARSDELLKEFEKGQYFFSCSERFFNIGVLAKEFPKSFQSIVIQGDLSSGVNLNGEAGVKTAPMYPFSPVSSLRHAAIAIKVTLGEFIEARNLEFKLLKGPEDYLFE
ncbi:hypothetical protein BDB01DRAFT_900001 [Pilobolus umbonatus]|nr:hypothetical protein BDB01DRAFT_900001 [Pilobolus umbonatus]